MFCFPVQMRHAISLRCHSLKCLARRTIQEDRRSSFYSPLPAAPSVQGDSGSSVLLFKKAPSTGSGEQRLSLISSSLPLSSSSSPLFLLFSTAVSQYFMCLALRESPSYKCFSSSQEGGVCVCVVSAGGGRSVR